MIKFGTGGWRAEIGKDFCQDNIRRVAYGFAQYIHGRGETAKPVMIGFDRRFLSDCAAEWIAEVLCANGVKVLFLHRSAPTPLVMHTVQHRDLFYGMEVTASHNPSTYNGIKIIVREGRDAPLEVTEALEKEINSIDGEIPVLPFAQCVEQGLVQYIENPFNDFLDSVLNVLDYDAIRARGPRILFDTMHGSATYPLLVVLHTTRCTVDLLHDNKDAYFGGMMPAPEEKTLTELSRKVVAGGYDLGIGVDGDGDRLGIVDADGQYITANEILVLLYYYLHEYKGWKGPVVRNLATTHMLDAVAADLGEQCCEVPVGFKYISSKIDEVDAVLGGESSGGLTVRGHIHGKDSVYAASLFVEMICKTGKTPTALMEELRAKYGNYVMVEDNIRFDPAQKEALKKTIMEDRALPDFGRPYDKVSYMDGCKTYFADGSFVVCRFSGTEPLLRIFAESGTHEKAAELIAAWKQFLKL
ncbi:MAG: phosphoglucomutase/phosphomannomutase family protein [Oscillospiraceae bacterium]|nr:phosphoglucomutase/phosphomannomutase family protein [Oscillospiraceae bacterium]